MKFFALCLVSILVATYAKQLAPLFRNDVAIPNQYVVVLEDNVDVTSFVHLVDQRITSTPLPGQLLLRKIISRTLIRAAVFDLDEANVEKMRALPGVKHIEENGVYHIDKGSKSWGQDRIDQRSGTNGDITLNSWGEGQDIWVIDTGVRPTHTEFESRATAVYDALDDGNGPVDCHGHGTHCAGTAAGKSYGVAAKARIFGVRVLDCRGSGSLASILDGISFVADATIGQSVVISMSLGGSYSETMNDLISDTVASGDIVVVAAGNEFQDACRTSPASEPTAITVGATEKQGDRKAMYSNHGPCLDIFAPGSSITSAWYTSDTATATLSGTSMAAPHVAGGVAVLMEQGIAADQIADYMTSTATTDAIDLGTLGANDTPNLLLYLE